jgi:two-component system, cell cycle sensor histidine kinase and response regulator CckA
MEQSPDLKKPEKTILVVDDDPQTLEIVSGFLRGQYNVLTANGGNQALQRSKDCKDAIDLLLTDFSMAGMTGIELATKITLARPTIKVLLMSGFTGGMLVLNEGWHFLPKPFISSQLKTLIVGLLSPDLKSRFSVATEWQRSPS